MTESKSLGNGYQGGSISSSERSKILEIGYIDDSPQLYLSSWRKLYFQAAKNNPDDYIKPLDIVKIAKSHYGGFIHTCIYLGNGKVVHNLPSGGVRFDSFSNFASFGGCSVMVRYHPIVAYKRREQIIEHIGKFTGGNFDFYKDNCENFANKCIYNDDISEHIKGLNAGSKTTKGREETTTTYSTETHGGGTSRVVMVSKTLGGTQTSCGASQQVTSRDFPTSTEQFDRLPRNYSTENEIKRYVESQSHYNGIILEQRIEIAPKSEYRMS